MTQKGTAGFVSITLTCNSSTQRTRRFRAIKPWAARNENFNHNTLRRLRQRGLEANFKEHVDVEIVYHEADGLCERCGDPVLLDAPKSSPWKAQFDHRYPICFGGRHEQRNIQLLHQICHIGKSKSPRPPHLS